MAGTKDDNLGAGANMLVDDNIDYDSSQMERILEIAGKSIATNYNREHGGWKYLAINIDDPKAYTDQQLEDQYMETEAESLWLAERALTLRDEMRRRREVACLPRPVVV